VFLFAKPWKGIVHKGQWKLTMRVFSIWKVNTDLTDLYLNFKYEIFWGWWNWWNWVINYKMVFCQQLSYLYILLNLIFFVFLMCQGLYKNWDVHTNIRTESITPIFYHVMVCLYLYCIVQVNRRASQYSALWHSANWH